MEANQVYQMTADTLLAQLERASVKLIATDPPYGIGYDAGTRHSHTGKARVTDTAFGEDVLQLSWLPLAYRAIRQDGALYVFARWDTYPCLLPALESAGFVVKQRLIWDKLHWGSGDLRYYGSQTEDILFCIPKDGTHKLNWTQREGNVWRLTKLDSINHEGNYDHPTQKPERLIRRIIERSSNPGDLVVDPFCGSGTTLVVAQQIGRRYIGGDIAEKYVAMARGRLALPYTIQLIPDM